jgi:L-threonylcarbamoyladenylate synthase
MITPADAQRAAEVLDDGGVILFGADTVYGLACAADRPQAIARMIALKGRDEQKPNAMLAFSLNAAEPLLAELGPRTAAAARALLPGPVTLVLPGGVGLRVPLLVPDAAALATIETLVVQSSANPAGEPAPAKLADVDPALAANADLVLDAGPLPGTASTVIDLRPYEASGAWAILRPGAVDEQNLTASLVIDVNA